MDHLPYPAHLGVPPIVVPYMPGYEYDHQDFETFPSRIGFFKNGLLDTNRPCHELASMAQSWLFFGLIEAYLDEELDTNLLIRKDSALGNNPDIIDTTGLHDILQANLAFLPWKNRRSLRAELLELADASSALFDLISEYEPSCAAVFLSIGILIAYLIDCNRAIQRIWRSDEELKPTWLNSQPSLPVRLLTDRMRQSGWCIHQIMQICRSHNYMVVYYLSSIRRQEPWGITHDACTEDQCFAYDTRQDNTYEVRHVEKDCICQLVEAPMEPVIRIIRNKGIPLIGIRKLQNDQIKLEVIESKWWMEYTAISHLWIDGLGNPTVNALPKCQLEKLAGRLESLSELVHPQTAGLRRIVRGSVAPLFWIDTLCIPVDPLLQPLRKKAMNRMNLIYAKAKRTLVLDQELATSYCEWEPPELRHARVLCSRWNSRCWTLQEAALANNVFYQFPNSAERIMSTIHLFTRILFKIRSKYLLAYFSHKAILEARESWNSSPVMAIRSPRRRGWETLDFAQAWNALGRRSTTMAEDIHVILANLTFFSAMQIMSLPTAGERTKMMLHRIGTFPLDMLFVSCSRPWANANNADRWIPSHPGPEPLEPDVLLQCTHKGLELDIDSRSSHLPEIVVAAGASIFERFCFKLSINSIERWVLVECTCVDHDQFPRDPSQTVCLMMSIPYLGDWIKESKLRGARLLVSEGRGQWPSEIYVRYDCPLVFGIQQSAPSNEQLKIYPYLSVTQMKSDTNVIIEQTIDEQKCEEFVMRTRKFYNKTTRLLCTIVPLFGGFSIVISTALLFLASKISFTAFNAACSTIATVLFLSLLFSFLYGRYQRRAWEATFDEDWVPDTQKRWKLLGMHKLRCKALTAKSESKV